MHCVLVVAESSTTIGHTLFSHHVLVKVSSHFGRALYFPITSLSTQVLTAMHNFPITSMSTHFQQKYKNPPAAHQVQVWRGEWSGVMLTMLFYV